MAVFSKFGIAKQIEHDLHGNSTLVKLTKADSLKTSNCKNNGLYNNYRNDSHEEILSYNFNIVKNDPSNPKYLLSQTDLIKQSFVSRADKPPRLS